MLYLLLLLVVAVAALVWTFQDTTIRDLQRDLDTALKLRQAAKALLSTNSGTTPPTPAKLSSASIAAPKTRYLTSAAAIASNSDLSAFTYAPTSAANIAAYNTARSALEAHVKAAVARALSSKAGRSSHLASAIDVYVGKLEQHLLGDCGTDDCGSCCFFGTCGIGDCGVCDCCQCSDPFCCPPAPSGWPGDCGDSGELGCPAAIPLIYTSLTGDAGVTGAPPDGICGSTDPGAALTLVCAAAVEISDSPGVTAVCAGIGANLGQICNSTASDQGKMISQWYGCTCPSIVS